MNCSDILRIQQDRQANQIVQFGDISVDKAWRSDAQESLNVLHIDPLRMYNVLKHNSVNSLMASNEDKIYRFFDQIRRKFENQVVLHIANGYLSIDVVRCEKMKY